MEEQRISVAEARSSRGLKSLRFDTPPVLPSWPNTVTPVCALVEGPLAPTTDSKEAGWWSPPVGTRLRALASGTGVPAANVAKAAAHERRKVAKRMVRRMRWIGKEVVDWLGEVLGVRCVSFYTGNEIYCQILKCNYFTPKQSSSSHLQ